MSENHPLSLARLLGAKTTLARAEHFRPALFGPCMNRLERLAARRGRRRREVPALLQLLGGESALAAAGHHPAITTFEHKDEGGLAARQLLLVGVDKDAAVSGYRTGDGGHQVFERDTGVQESQAGGIDTGGE